MNAQDKRWINMWLHKIWIVDNENDSQADDISEFLWELSKRSGFYYFDKKLTSSKKWGKIKKE